MWPFNRRPSPRPRAAARLCLEPLDDRWVPSTLTVTITADSGSGSLRDAIAAAQSGDTIVFDAALDGQAITLTGGDMQITKSVTITGPGAGLLAVSGNHLSRVFEVAAGAHVTLTGLTVSNGTGIRKSGTSSPNDLFGGGILNSGTLTVANCVVTHNSLNGQGGGIASNGTLTVTNSTLSYNTASAHVGGGIYNWPNATGPLTVTGCTLTNNSANNGGGIANNSNDTLVLSNSTLTANTATVGGGGVNNFFGTATISGCTLSNNSAGEGGGVFNLGTLTLTGGTISGNGARNGGGGVYANSGSATVSGTTLTGNTAPIGGAFYAGYGTVGLTNCTMQFNSAKSFGGGLYIFSSAAVSLDAFTVTHIVNNTDPSGVNGPTANIDGSYTLLP